MTATLPCRPSFPPAPPLPRGHGTSHHFVTNTTGGQLTSRGSVLPTSRAGAQFGSPKNRTLEAKHECKVLRPSLLDHPGLRPILDLIVTIRCIVEKAKQRALSELAI